MAKTQEKQIMNIVANAIEAAGYDPRAQLTGYLTTGNPAYITRQFGARKLVRSLRADTIRRYLSSYTTMKTA